MQSIILTNAGLMQDELLGEFALVSSGLKPASPATIQALTSIIEAVVLREVAYYGCGPSLANSVSSLVDEDNFVRELLPPVYCRHCTRGEHLKRAGDGYTWGEFLTDFGWQRASFLSTDVSAHAQHYQILNFLLSKYRWRLGSGRLELP